MTYQIDHPTLKRAAENLLAIDEAGMSGYLSQDISARCYADADRRRQLMRPTNQADAAMACWITALSRRLSEMLDAPLDQCRAVAIEMAGESIRSVTLEALAEWGRKARAQTAKTNRLPWKARS